jgi:uncharacterized protein YecT (DUF1311 family)
MQRFATSLLLLGLSFPPALADECMDKATAQADMNQCAAKAFRTSDAELNKSFQQLQRRLSDDATRKRLVAAQRAWLAFRDAECAFSAAGVQGGSAYPMTYGLCLDGLTRKRVEAIKVYLSCGDKEGDLSCPTSAAH